MVFRFKIYVRKKLVLLKFLRGLKPAKRMTGLNVQILDFVIYFSRTVRFHITNNYLHFKCDIERFIVFQCEINITQSDVFCSGLVFRKQLLLLSVFESIVSSRNRLRCVFFRQNYIVLCKNFEKKNQLASMFR